MKTSPAIWIVRREAAKLGKFLARELGGELFPRSFAPTPTNRERFIQAFPTRQRWVLVMTTGIAMRYLDGLPKSKLADPAVVVVDEAARFAISLLSGHEGGANVLAYRVAAVTGATSVITTATESLKPLVIGIGCRRGVSAKQINAAVQAALKQASRPLSAVREIATIDLKAGEPGLVRWCRQHDLPLRIFSRQTVAGRPWVTQPSAWVKKNIGVDGVCEPCALLASHNGILIHPKTAFAGVTVAIVEEPRPWIA